MLDETLQQVFGVLDWSKHFNMMCLNMNVNNKRTMSYKN